MERMLNNFACAALVLLALSYEADGQTRNRRPAAKNTPPVSAKVDGPAVPPKRNERPDGSSTSANPSPSAAGKVSRQAGDPAFEYEFSQPEFIVSHVKIQHGEDGTGTISFRKKGDDELITDPIRISPKALARINEVLSSMNFLDRTEKYQYEKDFSHLATIKSSLRRNGKSRGVTYNWSENKLAKELMAEYRRVTNQFIWIFDITLSRDNQPLEAPKLMDSLDSMIRRNEI